MLSLVPFFSLLPFILLGQAQVTTTTTSTTTTITDQVTSTDIVTSTDVIYVTDYVTDTVTQTLTETAYVIENFPSGVASLVPLTTAQPGGPAAPSGGPSDSGGSGDSGSGSSGSSDQGSPTSTTSGGLSPAVSSGSASAPVLSPIVPSNHNGSSLGNLTPQGNSSIVYTQNGTTDTTLEHIFAQVNGQYQYPTVILPHSTSVSTVECWTTGGTLNGLEIVFNNVNAYDYVVDTWTTDGESGFMLITNTLDCSSADVGQYGYWLVSQLTYNDASMIVYAKANEIAVEDAFSRVHIIWGTYVPGGGSPSNPNLPINSQVGGNSTVPDGVSSGPESVCANPPATYQGLPTVPCGESFDADLDDALGYIDPSDPNQLAAFSPDLAPDASQFPKRGTPYRRHRLGRRHWWNDVAHAIKSTVSSIGDGIASAAKATYNAAKTVVSDVASVAKSVYNTLSNPSFNSKVPINVQPSPLISSYFGTDNSLLLWSAQSSKGNLNGEIDIYCVNCGITGQASLSGEIDYTLIPFNINKANMNLEGNLLAQVNLGLYAQLAYKNTYTKQLYQKAIPEAGIKVGDLLTIGVAVTLDATATIDIHAEGEIYAGVSASIPDFKASFDVVHPAANTLSGFTPQFAHVFNASGTITADLQLGLPLEIGVGITIPKFSKQLGIVNTPKLDASATIVAHTAGADAVGDSTNANCGTYGGLGWSIGASDTLALDLFGYEVNLADIEKPGIFSGCVPFGAPSDSGAGNSTGSSGNSDSSNNSTDSGDQSNPDTSDSGSGDNSTISDGGDDPNQRRRSMRIVQQAERSHSNPWAPKWLRTFEGDSIDKRSNTPSNTTSVASNSTSLNTTMPSTDSTYNSTYNGTDAGYNSTNPDFFDGFDNSTDSGTAYNSTADDLSGEDYISIYDIANSYAFAYDGSGNFWLDNASNADSYLWGTEDSLVVTGGDGDNFLIYYPAEIAALGVSRFRLADPSYIPKTSAMILLATASDGEGNSIFLPISATNQAIFNMVYCAYVDLPGKIFLVEDITSGIDTLMSVGATYAVTGGVVEQCAPIALASTLADI